MKIAACLALLVALILFGDALTDISADANNAARSTERVADQLRNGDEAGLSRDEDLRASRQRTNAVEGVGGAAFVIAALVLWRKESDSSTEEESESFGNGLSLR